MAILNVTPDSFYRQSRATEEAALDQALSSAVEAGADLLDLGGMSSRPGAELLPEEVEWERLRLVLQRVQALGIDLPISVDTWRLNVAQQAVDMGAHIINDISGGLADPRLPEWAAAKALPYVVMHRQGDSKTMQKNPVYGNVLLEVTDWLSRRLHHLHGLGLHDTLVDPGFGFGKTLEHNLCLFNGLAHVKEMCERPLLVGISRKRMVQQASGVAAPEQALAGSLAGAVLALEQGADVLRVHDVAETRQAIDFWWACRQQKQAVS